MVERPKLASQSPNDCPVIKLPELEKIPERRANIHVEIADSSFDIVKRFSCLTSCIRITALIRRWIHNHCHIASSKGQSFSTLLAYWCGLRWTNARQLAQTNTHQSIHHSICLHGYQGYTFGIGERSCHENHQLLSHKEELLSTSRVDAATRGSLKDPGNMEGLWIEGPPLSFIS